MFKIVVILAIFLIDIVVCDNILIVHSMVVQSHVYTIRKLAHALASVGHEITIIRVLEVNPPKEINTSRIEELTFFLNNSMGNLPFVTHEENGRFVVTGDHLWKNGLSVKMFPLIAYKTTYAYCHALLGNERIIGKLNSKKYSVAIVDLLFNDCGLALANKFGVPIIGYWGFYFASGPVLYTSAFNLPSSIPQTLSHMTDNMSFIQRVMNTLVCITLGLLMEMQMYITHYAIQHHIPNAPHPKEMFKELSGALIDSHPGIDIPQSFPQSFVKIGGIHMENPKPLPVNIEKFISNDGEAGVILFSLGKIFDDKQIPGSVFQSYFNAFARLDQKVIVKSEGIPKHIPHNVMVLSFVPQLDILANNNTVLFITHGGIKGVIESIYYGVPMVGVPIFIDQKDTMIHMKELGAATLVEKDCSEETIHDNIQEVLRNPSYKEAAVKLSDQMRAHPDPKKVAVDLVQLVIRTNGADHLKLGSRNLNILQYICLDIIAFFILLVSGMIAAIYYALKLNILQKAMLCVSYFNIMPRKQKVP